MQNTGLLFHHYRIFAQNIQSLLKVRYIIFTCQILQFYHPMPLHTTLDNGSHYVAFLHDEM
jgi:hypothetical protein